MLKLSRKTLLALEAVLDVAYHARPDPVQSKDITARLGIPQRYLEQVMQQLVHRGVLKGVRGPRGGYVLARERRKITVGEVVRVVDQLDEDADPEPVSKAPLGTEVVMPLWEETRAMLLARLDSITMDDLCNRARTLNVAERPAAPPDYSI